MTEELLKEALEQIQRMYWDEVETLQVALMGVDWDKWSKCFKHEELITALVPTDTINEFKRSKEVKDENED